MLVFCMADENWAFSERRALTAPLTIAYYLGLALPMYRGMDELHHHRRGHGALARRSGGLGFDFAFSALFIGILAGFWRGPRTGAVLASSAVCAALAKLFVPGAWYIVIGGLTGVMVAAALHEENEAS